MDRHLRVELVIGIGVADVVDLDFAHVGPGNLPGRRKMCAVFWVSLHGLEITVLLETNCNLHGMHNSNDSFEQSIHPQKHTHMGHIESA